MKKSLPYLIVTLLTVSSALHSCKKKSEIRYVEVKDTTLVMTAKGWNAFSFETLALMDSGNTTYFTTAEGIKFVAQIYREGARLQTKTALPFDGKSLYYKWKGNGNGQFAAFVPQIKYDPFTTDGTPSIQGVDLTIFSTKNSYNQSVLIEDDRWYYTRITPVAGTANFQVITSTGNYSNKGGTVIDTKVFPIYTKSGYLAFRMTDTYSTSAYTVISEVKIAD